MLAEGRDGGFKGIIFFDVMKLNAANVVASNLCAVKSIGDRSHRF